MVAYFLREFMSSHLCLLHDVTIFCGLMTLFQGYIKLFGPKHRFYLPEMIPKTGLWQPKVATSHRASSLWVILDSGVTTGGRGPILV